MTTFTAWFIISRMKNLLKFTFTFVSLRTYCIFVVTMSSSFFQVLCLPVIHLYKGNWLKICLLVSWFCTLVVCLSFCLFVCLSAFLLVCLSVCLFVSLSACLLVSLSVCLFVYLSVCLFVSCLIVCLFVCLSVCLFYFPLFIYYISVFESFQRPFFHHRRTHQNFFPRNRIDPPNVICNFWKTHFFIKKKLCFQNLVFC